MRKGIDRQKEKLVKIAEEFIVFVMADEPDDDPVVREVKYKL